MALPPFPPITTDLTQQKGQAKLDRPWWQWMQRIDTLCRGMLDPVFAAAANALTTLAGQSITNGFTWQPTDLGTPVNGATITPNPSGGLKQKVTNNTGPPNTNAFTIAATAEIGDVELTIINGANPGIVNFAGFGKQYTSDAMTTNVGDRFAAFIYGMADGVTDYIVKARQ
jgi:hypothetical protein